MDQATLQEVDIPKTWTTRSKFLPATLKGIIVKREYEPTCRKSGVRQRTQPGVDESNRQCGGRHEGEGKLSIRAVRRQ